MSILRPVLIVLVVAAVAWWLLSDNDEARVRQAHEDLASLLSKPEDEGGAAAVLRARTLQGLLADSVAVTGDAGALAGSYTSEQAASTVAGVKGLFNRIDITFDEPSISFPADDEAVTEFTATMTGIAITEGQGTVQEMRRVVSTMKNFDGDWQFAAFRMTEPGVSNRSN
jgi:hypothetical protein